MRARKRNSMGVATLLALLTAGGAVMGDVIDDSLIVRYDFDAAPVGEVIIDSSPGGSDHPGANFDASWVDLAFDPLGVGRGGLMAFDSEVGSQITVPGHDDFDLPERGTISFWMKSAGIGAGPGHASYAMLVDRRTDTGFGWRTSDRLRTLRRTKNTEHLI